VQAKKTSPTLKSRQVLFDSLPETGRQVALTKATEGALPFSQWIKLLKVLDKLDRECEAGKRKAYQKGGMFLVIAVISIALVFLNPLLAIVPILLLIPGIAFLVRGSKFAKYDADNRLRLFLLPLLAIMKGDINKNAKVNISINLNKLKSRDFQTVERALPRSGNTIGGKDIFYEQDWMTLSMAFSDGTAVQIKATDLLRVRKMRKRSMSGKTKYKTKMKFKRTFRVATKFQKDVYQMKDGKTATETTDKYLIVKQKISQILQKGKEIPSRNTVLSGISQAYLHVIPKN
jgi:hypothetical protein